MQYDYKKGMTTLMQYIDTYSLALCPWYELWYFKTNANGAHIAQSISLTFKTEEELLISMQLKYPNFKIGKRIYEYGGWFEGYSSFSFPIWMNIKFINIVHGIDEDDIEHCLKKRTTI